MPHNRLGLDESHGLPPDASITLPMDLPELYFAQQTTWILLPQTMQGPPTGTQQAHRYATGGGSQGKQISFRIGLL